VNIIQHTGAEKQIDKQESTMWVLLGNKGTDDC
jgi:hypothetical protein